MNNDSLYINKYRLCVKIGYKYRLYVPADKPCKFKYELVNGIKCKLKNMFLHKAKVQRKSNKQMEIRQNKMKMYRDH